MLEDKELTEKIIACAFRVHQQLGAGFAEKVYENAMIIELRKRGFDVKQQSPISVYYEGKNVGEFFADILVENRIVRSEEHTSELQSQSNIECRLLLQK